MRLIRYLIAWGQLVVKTVENDRLHRYEKMDMIRSDVARYYFHVISRTNLPRQFPNPMRNGTLQYRLAVLRYPHQVQVDKKLSM